MTEYESARNAAELKRDQITTQEKKWQFQMLIDRLKKKLKLYLKI